MMPIKFKVLIDKKFYEVKKIEFDEVTGEIISVVTFAKHGNPPLLILKPEIVVQFTGLHDKNGQEIYKGDVLKVLTSSNFFVEVYFHKNAMFTCREITKGAPCSQIYAKESEVVGNIYENPELLDLK